MTAHPKPAVPLVRRQVLLGAPALALAGTAARAAATDLPALRLGELTFGTVQWVADVIRRHGLDRAHGLTLRSIKLANNEAGRIALMAGSADVVVTDWLFVAAQRARGTKLCFSPLSSATGGVMVRGGKDGAALHSLADLAGKRLGVAGGPLDKSWLILQAAARAQHGPDLARTARLAYGAPPLLDAKLLQGQLDAVLTYWNFAARLAAQGCREMASVSDCAATLGLPRRLSLIGFAFHEDWARQNRPVIDGFLAAAAAAEARLAASPAEWQAVRPLMDASDDALFDQLRRRFVAGIAHPAPEDQARTAARVLDVLKQVGGTRATEGLSALPQGVFWHTRAAAL